MSYDIKLANPVKLDVTYSGDGVCVQYNGNGLWLAYDSQEMIDYRAKCLDEFNQLPFRKKYLEDNK